MVIHGLKHCNVEGSSTHPNSPAGIECHVKSYIKNVTVDNSFLWVGFGESEPPESLLFVTDLIGAVDLLIKQYVDAGTVLASSTLVEPNQRAVVRFSPDISQVNIVPPSPRQSDGSDPRSRLLLSPPRGIREPIVEASDSDGSPNSDRTVVRSSPLQWQRGPRTATEIHSSRGRGRGLLPTPEIHSSRGRGRGSPQNR